MIRKQAYKYSILTFLYIAVPSINESFINNESFIKTREIAPGGRLIFVYWRMRNYSCSMCDCISTDITIGVKVTLVAHHDYPHQSTFSSVSEFSIILYSSLRGIRKRLQSTEWEYTPAYRWEWTKWASNVTFIRI